MNNQPLVSIITVSFNAERYIEQTILSVINQSYRNIEYIIIDGGSTDNTINIIKKYERYISYWISQKDRGISDAFNKGIANSNGYLIGIINADDWYETDTVENVIKHYDGSDVYHGDLQYWKQNKKYYTFSANHNLLYREMTVNHMTVFVKKEIYMVHGLFKENYKYAMDYELLLRFYLNNVSFFYIPKVLAHMRLDGISDKNWKKALKECKYAKIENKINPVISQIYYVFQLIRTIISKLMQDVPTLVWIVAFYRNHFSVSSKKYN